MTGSMNKQDVFGTNLQGSHPFSLKLPLVDAPDLVASLVATHTTGDPAVKLIANNVECTSCHSPHVQAIDTLSQNFLVRDSANGQLCVACHEVNPRTVGGQTNPLAPWPVSIHAQAGNRIANGPILGSYLTVAQNACISCHMPHNSVAGAGLAARTCSSGAEHGRGHAELHHLPQWGHEHLARDRQRICRVRKNNRASISGWEQYS
jgi:predicted CXXCH cytochrome family protein